jgi:excinuclease ABC subunit A
MDTPWRELPEGFRELLLEGSGEQEIALGQMVRGNYRRRKITFEGVLPNLARRLAESPSESVRKTLRGYMGRRRCSACGGRRLRPEALACRVADYGLMELLEMPVEQARGIVETLPLSAAQMAVVGQVLGEIRKRLQFLDNVGLGYLTLNRESATLSGGEMQRIRLATQIGSALVGVLYVLDEPTIGLHARDNRRLIATLRDLQGSGNTVVVVEHDEEMIREADHVIDLGPGAGRHGGEVVFEGDVAALECCDKSLTGKFLRGSETIELPERRVPAGVQRLVVEGATANNLKDITVELPLGCLIAVTGVSGSGKSTLVDEVLRRHVERRLSPRAAGNGDPGACRAVHGVEWLDKLIVIDQGAIGRTPRSNAVTYTGAFGLIRELFAATPVARARGYGPGRFSFNVKGGRCEVCKGDGMIRMEMHFLPDVYVTCEQCGGLRYNRETLEVNYGGRSIAEVLSLTVDEACEAFGSVPRLARILGTLADVGLGYLQLGQSATTLSGGEAQRMKLAAELQRPARGHTLYLLDEPTTGLHFADVRKLLEVLFRLRDKGHTVLVVEHNLDVIKVADYVVDLGPEGGDAGGYVVAQGTPKHIADTAGSFTGQCLAPYLR